MLLTGHGLKIKTEPIVLPTLLIFFFAVHTRNGGVEQFGGGGGRPEQMK